jgi:hypothetical protein
MPGDVGEYCGLVDPKEGDVAPKRGLLMPGDVGEYAGEDGEKPPGETGL